MYGLSRGELNNNPGNIRISGSQWLGKREPSKDASFEQFDTPINGIRALAKLLFNYFKDYGLSTVTQIISRWAPGSENNTAAYITDVAADVGCGVDANLDLSDPQVLGQLVRAIIVHENGSCIYSANQIDEGVNSALGGVT